MGYFSKQLKNYFANASAEQLEQDKKILEKYSGVGLSLEEYFNDLEISDITVINQIDR